ITGMFQSSSTASGIARLQASNAFSPSSASTIWKSRPSRIRRATFRMTLESSTTRHVLMAASLPPQRGYLHSSSFAPLSGALCRRSCSLGVRRKFKHLVDVEDDHELAVETVDTAGELGHAGVEVDGVFFLVVLGQAQHLADLVDQEAIGFAAQVDADPHRRLAVLGPRQAEPRPHVDHGDYAA